MTSAPRSRSYARSGGGRASTCRCRSSKASRRNRSWNRRASRTFEDAQGLRRVEGIFRLDEMGLSPLDHATLYGDGAFEGILIRKRSIFLYREHMDRLDRSIDAIGIEHAHRSRRADAAALEDGARRGPPGRQRLHSTGRHARDGGSRDQSREMRRRHRVRDRLHDPALLARSVRTRDQARPCAPHPPSGPHDPRSEHQESELSEQRARAPSRGRAARDSSRRCS